MGHDVNVHEPQARRRTSGTPRLSRARRVITTGLAGMAAFQLAIAAGAPVGRASYGGAHPGVLPSRLRAVSAGSALVYSGLAATVASRRTPVRVRRRVLTGVAALMGVGVVMNGVSPSWPERAIWTPTTAVLALSAWRARDEQ